MKLRSWRRIVELSEHAANRSPSVADKTAMGDLRVSPQTTAQFVIERARFGEVHPQFPVAVWVEFPPCRKNTYGCDKCDLVYRVTEDSVAEQELIFGKSVTRERKISDGYFCVCDCMGHLIE